ncbi:hypothetical protein CYMTET_29622 [Cymbomonas tetramitiformis]|uniref:Uncharacterized protein n=1 Tax=Cymbomonas tetramitiformis TaxID=36881 RepID=A0AAE0KUQ8_9CHLO|nr:hypothetical protein CYMTET_29622 [Cymbomonas tetramitiformis]
MYRLTNEASRSIQSLKEHSVHGNRTKSKSSLNLIEGPPSRQWTWSSRDHSSRRLYRNEENSLVDLGDIFPGLLERKYVFFDENVSDDDVNVGSFGSIHVPQKVKVGRNLMKASLQSYKKAFVVASFVQGFYVCSLVHVMAHHLDIELQQGLTILASAAAAALLFAPSLCNSFGAHGTLTLGCILYAISAWCYLIGMGCTGEVKTGCERLIDEDVGISEQASDIALVIAPLAGGAAYSFVWIGQGMIAECCLAPFAEFVDAGHRLNMSKFNLFFIGLSYALIMVGQLVAHYGDRHDVYDLFTSLTLLTSFAAIWVGWKYKSWLKKGVERDAMELTLDDTSSSLGSGVDLMKEYRLTQAAAHRARLGELRKKMGLPSSSTGSNEDKDPAAGKSMLKWNEVLACLEVPEAARLMLHPVMLKLLPFSVSTGLLLPLVFSQITDSIADGDLGEDAIYTVIFLAMLAVLCFLIPLCKLMLEDPNGRLITLCSGQGCSLLAVILTPVMASLTKSAIDDNPNVRWAAIGISAILLGIAQAVWEYAVPLTVSEFFTGQMAPFVCSALSAARFQLLASLLLGESAPSSHSAYFVMSQRPARTQPTS